MLLPALHTAADEKGMVSVFIFHIQKRGVGPSREGLPLLTLPHPHAPCGTSCSLSVPQTRENTLDAAGIGSQVVADGLAECGQAGQLSAESWFLFL